MTSINMLKRLLIIEGKLVRIAELPSSISVVLTYFIVRISILKKSLRCFKRFETFTDLCEQACLSLVEIHFLIGIARYSALFE